MLLDFSNTVLERSLHIAHLLPECSGMRTKVIIGKCVNLHISCQHLVKDRLDGLVIPVSLGTEQLFDKICQCHIKYKFCLLKNPSNIMNIGDFTKKR